MPSPDLKGRTAGRGARILWSVVQLMLRDTTLPRCLSSRANECHLSYSVMELRSTASALKWVDDPLDLTFFGPLKSTFNNECETFLKTDAAQKITPYDIAKIFNQAYGRVSSVEKATNGFKEVAFGP
ncbi:hypothetical protein ANN_10186 [Periplaneta americana]|uniref:Per a allergen n=1 Tax=Periplaneta americana TaxID=6978 RepID=A0ABQ8TQQ6_PERAM|nr:hypothetical protein ANN_10186 [Periplaneta americana]